MANYKVLIIGNSNTGKTSLFNAITKSFLKTGNYFGVTVGAYKKSVKAGEDIVTFADLPGTVSLAGAQAEQIATRDAVYSGDYDSIIYVCSAMSLARNLYLLYELKSLGVKNITVAVNMCDEAQQKGVEIDYQILSNHYGFCFIPVSAKKKINIKALVKEALKQVGKSPAIKTVQQVTGQIINERYKDIDCIISKAVKNKKEQTELSKFEKFTLGKKTGIFFFAVVMTAVFFVVFWLVGTPLSDLLGDAADSLNNALKDYLNSRNIPGWSVGLLCHGIIDGAIIIIKFLPQIVLLYLLLAFLEDIGYLSRAAYVTDSSMSRLALCGRSTYTLLLGFGCTAAAAPTARAIDSPGVKLRTVLLTPFMSCSAKLPVFSLIATAFFGRRAAVVVLFFYLLGILSFYAAAKVLKKSSGEYISILEIPPYRLPSAKRVLNLTVYNCGQFFARVGSLVLTVNIFVWLLSHYGPTGQYIPDGQCSLMYLLTQQLAIVFRPLGITDWRAVSALISGLAAKEVIISSMAALGGLENIILTSRQAMVFMVFVLYYTPCFAALASMSKEIGFKYTLISAAAQFALAYFAALALNILWGFFTKARIGDIIIFLISVGCIIAARAISAEFQKPKELTEKVKSK